MPKAQPALGFYDAPIQEVIDATPSNIPATETEYRLGWGTDRDVEWLAAGLVTDALRERAKSLLMWKNRYWQGTTPQAAEGAHELYLELLSYGLEV